MRFHRGLAVLALACLASGAPVSFAGVSGGPVAAAGAGGDGETCTSEGVCTKEAQLPTPPDRIFTLAECAPHPPGGQWCGAEASSDLVRWPGGSTGGLQIRRLPDGCYRLTVQRHC